MFPVQARPVQGANPDRLDIMAQKSSPSPAARFFGNDDWDAPAEQHTPAPAAGTEDPGLSTAALEESVRPRSLDDFIGQEELRANLRVYLGAARERGCALDHTLFYGNPGLGKRPWPRSWLPSWASTWSAPRARAGAQR